MKKSIKYAGIAAATLLTVAPVAAPVVSNVTTVKAAGNTDGSDVTTATTNFTDQFGDREVNDLKDSTGKITLGNLTLGEASAPDTLGAFITDNKALIKSPIADADVTTKLKALTDQNAKAYITVTANGVTYDGSVGKNVTELAKALDIDENLPATVNVYLKSNTLSTNSDTEYKSVATFKINKSDANELTSVNAKFTTPLNVAKKSKALATQLVNGANLSIVDQDGESLATQDITLDNSYYYTYAQAMDAAKAKDAATDPSTVVNQNGNVQNNNSTDVIDKDGKFAKAGTYYQTVTYTAKSGSSLDSLITDYQTDPNGYTIYVNGKKASSGYDFTSKAATDKTPASITFVRAINVSDNEAQWTTTDKAGVVTTKNGSAYYTLKDDEGNTITNRALAKNTDWATDKVRTDQNGNKQYRVATGEWIDANDVTFSEKGDNNNNAEGAYTDVQALNGKVTLDGPSSFIYMLYNDNGASVSNRALAGNSEWYTDKKATNAAGQTVYHVATGEWVQAGNGVNYVAY